MYDELDVILKCDIADTAAAQKNIGAIVGSQPVEVRGFKPSPAGVTADSEEIAVVAPAKPVSADVQDRSPARSSKDSLHGVRDVQKEVVAPMSVVKTTQSEALLLAGDSVPYISSLGYPTPTHRPRASSQELSPSSQSATPQHLPPPADTPSGTSSDLSTLSEQQRAGMDTPSHLPPPPETPPASWPSTPHVGGAVGHAMGAAEEEYLAAADFSKKNTHSGSASSMAPKRARLE